MGTLRAALAIIGAGISVPLICHTLQSTAIGMSNGHWLALPAAMWHSLSLLPLAVIAALINLPGAALVAAFSRGLELLIGRRSLLIWIGHGAALGLLNLLWLFPYSRPPLIVFGVLGSWMLASLVMGAVFSPRRPLDQGPRPQG